VVLGGDINAGLIADVITDPAVILDHGVGTHQNAVGRSGYFPDKDIMPGAEVTADPGA
jgi:hypothetical protein